MNKENIMKIVDDVVMGDLDRDAAKKLIDSKFTVVDNNKPAPICYSSDCPAIWDGKCTSTRYADCGIKINE